MSVEEQLRHIDDLWDEIASGPDQARPDTMGREEKIRHVQDLWDRVAANPDRVELTKAQVQELDRRLQDLHENPDAWVTWEEVRRRAEEAR